MKKCTNVFKCILVVNEILKCCLIRAEVLQAQCWFKGQSMVVLSSSEGEGQCSLGKGGDTSVIWGCQEEFSVWGLLLGPYPSGFGGGWLMHSFHTHFWHLSKCNGFLLLLTLPRFKPWTQRWKALYPISNLPLYISPIVNFYYPWKLTLQNLTGTSQS